jgi:hypothetical protein
LRSNQCYSNGGPGWMILWKMVALQQKRLGVQ